MRFLHNIHIVDKEFCIAWRVGHYMWRCTCVHIVSSGEMNELCIFSVSFKCELRLALSTENGN